MKFPRTLLGGRIRSSTVALMTAFFAVLTVWILVRPVPVEVTEEVVTVRTTKKVTADKTVETDAAPTPTPRPAGATPKPTPEAGKPTPDAGVPTPSPGGVGGLLAPATPTPTPTPVLPFQG